VFIRLWSMCLKGRGGFGICHPIGLNDVFVEQKCIRLMLEKLTIFPYGQYIIGNVCLLAFQKCS